MWYLILAACALMFAFNLWAMIRNWIELVGHVTRMEVLILACYAAILPAGFIIALILLASQKWPNAWSWFWDKDVLP